MSDEFRIPTFWCDKDGVLARYDYSLYEPEFGAPAPWLVRNAHVYKNVEPYENMCEAFKRLYKETVNLSMYKRSFNLKVLTLVSNGLTLSEHVLDGVNWCEKYLDLLPRDFFACAVPKEDVPISLHMEITPMDILLDDYMPNLRKWKDAGGTAIKVINGINSVTDEFPYFYNKPEPEYIMDVLTQIARNIKAGYTLSVGQFGPKAELMKYSIPTTAKNK